MPAVLVLAAGLATVSRRVAAGMAPCRAWAGRLNWILGRDRRGIASPARGRAPSWVEGLVIRMTGTARLPCVGSMAQHV